MDSPVSKSRPGAPGVRQITLGKYRRQTGRNHPKVFDSDIILAN
jgi:hypothetical protein